MGDVVPHLLVEQMDFLKSLDIVELGWRISDNPESQIVHVGHLSPGVLKLGSHFLELVFKLRLLQVLLRSQRFHKSLLARL